MRPQAQDIMEVIANAGLGTLGVDLFMDRLQETPDFQIVVVNTSGFAPDPDPQFQLFRPSFQVLVRSAKNGRLAAYSRLSRIYLLLNGKTNFDIGGSHYLQIVPSGDIMAVSVDENNREILSANFDAQRTPK